MVESLGRKVSLLNSTAMLYNTKTSADMNFLYMYSKTVDINELSGISYYGIKNPIN